MKRAVTLYEFMPYGAPELIESRQRHLSQALVISSATALVLYALAGGLVSLIKVTPPEPHRTVVDPRRFILPLPLVEVAPPAPALPAAHAARPTSPVAPPVPVPDPVAPPMDLPAPARADASGTGPAVVIGPSDVGTAPPGGDALPAPDVYIYVEHLPVVVRQVVPDYPPIAKDAGVEGVVMVKALVGKHGRVLDTRLVEKFQVPMLNAAALAAARQWVFTPGLANGRPVACWTAIPFRFRLH
ncbi:MAG: energy transducer TonB [Candidatus Eisenbacteria bacterium]